MQHDQAPLQYLAALGLSITSHSDPTMGWGYTWQGRDWVGPFTTPDDALHAAFTEALQALLFRSEYSWALFAHAGDLWRSDGKGQGWRRIGGPGLEDDEEANMLAYIHALYGSLNMLREIETRDITIPGPAQRWEQALRVGYRAYSTIEAQLENWHDELQDHHQRERRAEEMSDEE
jgi:hypothetical protein